VFTRLEKATKGSSKLEPLWGKHVHEWKKNEWLRWVRASRDVSHHLVEQVASAQPGRITEVTPTEADYEALRKEAARLGKPVAPIALLEVINPHVILLDVANRGTTYAAPKMPDGRVIAPYELGDWLIAHLEKILREIESLGV
jgi:hypothetical protein